MPADIAANRSDIAPPALNLFIGQRQTANRAQMIPRRCGRPCCGSVPEVNPDAASLRESIPRLTCAATALQASDNTPGRHRRPGTVPSPCCRPASASRPHTNSSFTACRFGSRPLPGFRFRSGSAKTGTLCEGRFLSLCEMRFHGQEKNRGTLKQAMRILHTIISRSKDRLIVLVCDWPFGDGK